VASVAHLHKDLGPDVLENSAFLRASVRKYKAFASAPLMT